MATNKMSDVIAALLVLVKTPHIRAYLQTTDPMALKQAETAVLAVDQNLKLEEPVLTEIELINQLELGKSARQKLAQRYNRIIHAREVELRQEMEDQKSAINVLRFHRELQTLPIVKKQIDRVLSRMETRLDLLGSEEDRLKCNRMDEEEYGRPTA